MIDNENKFLKLIIKNKNDDDTFSVSKIIEKSDLNALQCRAFLISLSNKGIIMSIDLDTYQINPIAYSTYQSTGKRIKKVLKRLTVFSFQRLIDFLIGVAVGIVTACITQHFFG